MCKPLIREGTGIECTRLIKDNTTNPPSRFVHEKSENFGSDKQRRLRGCDRPHAGAVPRDLSSLKSD